MCVLRRVSLPLCQNACATPRRSQNEANAKWNSREEIASALNAIPNIGGFNICVWLPPSLTAQQQGESCGKGILCSPADGAHSLLHHSLVRVEPRPVSLRLG